MGAGLPLFVVFIKVLQSLYCENLIPGDLETSQQFFD